MSKKKNKQNIPSLMMDYVGMTCKVSLTGKVAVRKDATHKA